MFGSPDELRRDDRIGPLGGQREMTGPLLDVADGPCQRPVNRTALPDRRLLAADRRQQWMRETHPGVVELDDLLARGNRNRLAGSLEIAVRCGDQLDRRLR